MSIKEMRCQNCAGAGLNQRFSWGRTHIKGILMCQVCRHNTDFRFQHAEKHGGNGWLFTVVKFGKTAFRCKRDKKWAFPNWDKAHEYAGAYGQRAYYDHKCGFIHLTSSAIRD